MATLTLPQTWVNGETADGTEVLANLNAIVTSVNTELVHRDGSRSLTGHMLAPVAPISSSQHLTPKSYVDAAVAAAKTTWQTWTPVVTQGAVVTHTVVTARYKVVDNNMLVLQASLTMTSAGTSGSALTITGLPLNPVDGYEFAVGSFDYFDSGTGFYGGSVLLTTPDSLIFRLGGTNGGGAFALGSAFGAANNDRLTFTATLAL